MFYKSITIWFVLLMCVIGFIGVLPFFQRTFVGGLALTTWVFIIGYWILPLISLLYSKVIDSEQRQ